jgi:hypothetical protein
MAKPCCETGNTPQTPLWKIWIKRTWYIILIAMVVVTAWIQFIK